MLYQFEVSGFKSFNEKFSFRLDGAKEYSFNREAVRNDVIKTGIVYGVNGIGKSNLGLALFDIIFHITQGFESNSAYTSNYLNLESKNDYAEFSYLFRFDEHYLKYTYRKKSLKEILFEEIQKRLRCYLLRSKSHNQSIWQKSCHIQSIQNYKD